MTCPKCPEYTTEAVVNCSDCEESSGCPTCPEYSNTTSEPCSTCPTQITCPPSPESSTCPSCPECPTEVAITCPDCEESSGTSCESKDYCATSPCTNGGTCYNGTTTFICVCSHPYSGEICQDGKNSCFLACLGQ